MADDSGLPALPETAKVQARLLAPLSTKFSRKGDIFSARVVDPGPFQGGIIEGEVREVRPGTASSKSAGIQFDIMQIHQGERAVPISGSILEVMNSRGQAGIEDEGWPLDGGGKAASRSGAVRLGVKAESLVLGPGSTLVLQIQVRKAK